MDVTPLIPKGHQLIDAYGDGGFVVSEQRHDGSILVFADHTDAWPVASLEALTEADFAPILSQNPAPEVVLVGCGAEFALLPKALRKLFRARGIAVEAMDTGAACRTYNILLAEGRRVVAALIAV